MNTNRFDVVPSANGHSKPARKPRVKSDKPSEPESLRAEWERLNAEHKPARKMQPAPVRPAVESWAYAGVYLTLGMSAALNGYANAEHAPAAWAGWAMGISVPALVLILSRVGSLLLKSSRRALAYAAGVVCVALLALSVTHCAESIARLTGGGMLLSVLMSVGIDCGLVVCELATVSKSGK